VSWDPAQYLRFADHRSRPFAELLARVAADEPSYVVDLGCGPGGLTATLAERWPGALVVGVDSSAEMVASAQEHAVAGRLEFVQADLREWTPDRPVDVLVSNATLQWVPGHLELLPALVDRLAPDGWLAVQVPGNFDEPSHTELADLRRSPRWRDLVGEGAQRAGSHPPHTYLERLADLGLVADVWETTYLQVLAGEDAVLEWTKGTALRPVLAALGPEDTEEFVADYAERLRRAYPRRSYGTVMPFRRIFFVAHKEAR
jgi:trans-aconitate 2-methyltransferase